MHNFSLKNDKLYYCLKCHFSIKTIHTLFQEIERETQLEIKIKFLTFLKQQYNQTVTFTIECLSSIQQKNLLICMKNVDLED